MGRFIILIGVCLVVLGILITMKVPMTWIGRLPGDFSFYWGKTHIYIPFATSVIFSFTISILLLLFTTRR